MTGPDEADRLRARLAAGVEHLPPTVAPYERILRDGTRARRRRTALLGASVAAVVVASVLTAASLSGSSTRASGPAGAGPAVAPGDLASSATAPTEAATPKPAPIASGEFAGHRWDLVHAPALPPTRTPLTGYSPGCEVIEVLLDGRLDNRGGEWCASSPGGPPPSLSSEESPGIATIGVGDTALYKPGVGSLGSITCGVVSPNVVRVVAKFDNGAPSITVTPTRNGPNGRSFYAIPVASGAGYGESGSLHFYDARGEQIVSIVNLGLGMHK